MNISTIFNVIEEYLDLKIGSTSWAGETNHDNESLDNLSKVDDCLSEIENIRELLLSRLDDHINYRKGNASAESLHKYAKRIRERHIVNDFPDNDFEQIWEQDNE